MDDPNDGPSDNSKDNNQSINESADYINHSSLENKNDLIMEVKNITIVDNEKKSIVHEFYKNTDGKHDDDKSTDLNMEVENNITVGSEINCKKHDHNTDDTSNKKSETNKGCEEIPENNCFGSHILNAKSVDLEDTKFASSFAMISESYNKSRIDNCSNNASQNLNTLRDNDVTTDCNEVTKLDSDSAVILPEGKLTSTLSMISQNYQNNSSDDDDSSSDSSSDNNNEESELILSDNEGSIISTSSTRAPKELVKTKGELTLSDLPPIEDLKISVDENLCKPVGCVKSIVDSLVIVEGFINIPALDIDSVLFVDRGQRAMGRVFDVFGPVNKPFYAVRFNDSNHIKNFNIQIKEPVYCADKTEYTSYVMVSKLMEVKGSDASWKDNNEPPPECLDYSDDEQEKLAKKSRKKKQTSNADDDNKTQGNKYSGKPKKENPHNSSQHYGNSTNHAANYPPQSHSTGPQSHSTGPQSHSTGPQSHNTGQFNNQPQQSYSPHMPNRGYGYGQQFPTYAQHLSSMEFNHSYRQPYNNSWYPPNQQMYPPNQNYGYQNPQMPPGPEYRQPRPNGPINPSRFTHPNYNYFPNYPNNNFM